MNLGHHRIGFNLKLQRNVVKLPYIYSPLLSFPIICCVSFLSFQFVCGTRYNRDTITHDSMNKHVPSGSKNML